MNRAHGTPISSKRPRSIAELVAAAREFPWDPSKPFKDILMTASALRSCGDKDRAGGDLEGAFINYARAATIALEIVPQHPNYSDLSEVLRQNLLLNGIDAQDRLAELRPLLIDKYEMHGANKIVNDNSAAVSSSGRGTIKWPPSDYADSDITLSWKPLIPPAVPSSSEGRSPIYGMKKLFQRQKDLPPRSMVPVESSPAEEHWIMLAPRNGATPAIQLPPGAGHDPAVARGSYDLASANPRTEHSSPPSQAIAPAGGKLQKKGGFFSRYTDLYGKDVSNASGSPQSQPLRDHSRRHEDGPTSAPGELTRMIGYLTGFAADDWTVVLEVCERAAASEANAREAAKALHRELKYAEPSAQMAAARLWAIMLRYSSEIFMAQTTTKKFLEVVEEVCTSSKTTPVVRDRLLEVIAGAAFAHPVPEKSGFAGLWRRIKAPGQPDEGIPFDDLDPMFTPPAPKAQRQPYLQHSQHPSYDLDILPQLDTVRQYTHAPPTGGGVTAAQQYAAQFGHLTSHDSQGYGNYQAANGGRREREVRVPSAEEEIRNLYNQCELARNNARLLSKALVYAKPIELASNPVIKEFHTKCMESEDFIVEQIPWATASSDRSREKLQEQRAIAAWIQGEDGQQQQETAEEQLLALLLQANQDLAKVFEQYDELERLGAHEQEENEVALRSLQETRLDRAQIQYYSADGSFQLEAPGGGVGAGGSGSRSPSPSPLASTRTLGARGAQATPQISHQDSNIPYELYDAGQPPPYHIATQSPTPASPEQNGRQIRQLPPTPVESTLPEIFLDLVKQQQYGQYTQLRDQPRHASPTHPNQQQVHLPLQQGANSVPSPIWMTSQWPRVTNAIVSEAEDRIQRDGAGGGSEAVTAIPQSDGRAAFRRTVEQLREQAKEKATLLRISLAVGGKSQLEREVREQCVALLAMIQEHHRRALDEDQSDQLKDESSSRKRLSKILFEAETLIKDGLQTKPSVESELQPQSPPEARDGTDDAASARKQDGSAGTIVHQLDDVPEAGVPHDHAQNQIVSRGLLPAASVIDADGGAGYRLQAPDLSMPSASEPDVHQESLAKPRFASFPRADGRQLVLRMGELPRLETECTLARENARKLEDALDQAGLHDLPPDQETQDLQAGCQTNRDWATDWIPWAKATVTLSRNETGKPPLEAEQLLAKLLFAREELTDVLRRYHELFIGPLVDGTNFLGRQVSSESDVGGGEDQERDASVSQQRFQLASTHRSASPSPSDGSSTPTTVTVMWTSEDVRQDAAAIRTRPLSIATSSSGSDTEYDPNNLSHVAAKAGMESLDDDVHSLSSFNSHML